MARAPTTTDAFAAIAEPRRREILGVLARADVGVQSGHDVNWLVEELGWPQPQVSKHLAVLRQVGLVSVVRKGRQRMYSLNATELRTVFDWVKQYEKFWEHHLDRIKARAECAQRASRASTQPSRGTPPSAPASDSE